ncbi:hypothetical protein N7491_009518 [Penicillium cf. griseofulvum]|uniref:Uncharacterized protein n=1 Tax=Penicillium cf. griseofulvum TaxID=2972120 RepID=A0A9W9JNP3_9EURO|nr:hypothetical protein N7472_004888 [Penicillium cf. griseofulvum]KAJ5424302.1 hypothetical protein N7491_009518 [Penicillium cf. griseofulvum]KAJ5442456.1 hypothetical protein N7445_005463 [Penicillium cf. griseofulvum]
MPRWQTIGPVGKGEVERKAGMGDVRSQREAQDNTSTSVHEMAVYIPENDIQKVKEGNGICKPKT